VLARLFQCHAVYEQAVHHEVRNNKENLEKMKRFVKNYRGKLNELHFSSQDSRDASRSRLFEEILERSRKTIGFLKILQEQGNRIKITSFILSALLTENKMFKSTLTIASYMLPTKGWNRTKIALRSLFTKFGTRNVPEFDQEEAVKVLAELLEQKPQQVPQEIPRSQLKAIPNGRPG